MKLSDLNDYQMVEIVKTVLVCATIVAVTAMICVAIYLSARGGPA